MTHGGRQGLLRNSNNRMIIEFEIKFLILIAAFDTKAAITLKNSHQSKIPYIKTTLNILDTKTWFRM